MATCHQIKKKKNSCLLSLPSLRMSSRGFSLTWQPRCESSSAHSYLLVSTASNTPSFMTPEGWVDFVTLWGMLSSTEVEFCLPTAGVERCPAGTTLLCTVQRSETLPLMQEVRASKAKRMLLCSPRLNPSPTLCCILETITITGAFSFQRSARKKFSFRVPTHD